MRKSIYQKAKQRVKKKKEFYNHLVSYIMMVFFLFMINMLTAPEFWWWLIPAGGWGIAIAFHYVDVFGIPGIGALSEEWEEEAIAAEIKRLSKKSDHPLEEEQLDLEDLETKPKPQERNMDWDDSELV